MKRIIVLLIISLGIIACKSDNKDTSNQLQNIDQNSKRLVVKIGILKDPPSLLPLKRRTRESLQITPYIFLQAADYNPASLENEPILLENIPDEISIDTGKYRNTYRYDLVFKKNAKWDNGTPITAKDYLFTLKLMLNPMLELHPAIRSMYSQIVGVELYPQNPRKISVYTIKEYMSSKEMITNLEIYPEYFYDSLGVMSNIDFVTIKNKIKAQEKLKTIADATSFAERFSGTHFMRNFIAGSGPYELVQWETNQYIKLKRKKNWWGAQDSQNSQNSYLQNNPEEIIFKIIPDRTTSLTELKNGNIDLLKGVLGSDFVKMKNNPKYSQQFDFLTPLSSKYYAIVLNNRNSILKEKNIRKAISYLIDVDFLLKTFGTGDEKLITSPINPNKTYYNNTLKPIRFDLNKAKELVTKSGWKDSDGDGIVDKIINGKKQDLSLSITTTGKPVAKGISLMLKDNAKKIGINITVDLISSKKYRKNKREAKFDIMPIVSSKDLVDYDPYPKWHSDNATPGSSNTSGFQNKECDKLIEQIIMTKDKSEKERLYRKFQELLYEERPVIFLFAETNNIIVNKNFSIVTSPKRPGYFANTVKLK